MAKARKQSQVPIRHARRLDSDWRLATGCGSESDSEESECKQTATVYKICAQFLRQFLDARSAAWLMDAALHHHRWGK